MFYDFRNYEEIIKTIERKQEKINSANQSKPFQQKKEILTNVDRDWDTKESKETPNPKHEAKYKIQKQGRRRRKHEGKEQKRIIKPVNGNNNNKNKNKKRL